MECMYTLNIKHKPVSSTYRCSNAIFGLFSQINILVRITYTSTAPAATYSLTFTVTDACNQVTTGTLTVVVTDSVCMDNSYNVTFKKQFKILN